MSKRISIIDMGTNTFHLLIAEVDEQGKTHYLHNEKVAVKIGEGGISNGYLTDEAQLRGLKALVGFKEENSRFGVEETQVFATSALRSASNSEDFIKTIVEKTGFSPQIINGEKEAEYIFHGVKSAMEISDKPNLIMDIGGGSVEFIIANNDQIFWKQSFEIGAQRLKDKFHVSDPIPEKDLKSLYEFLDNELEPLVDVIHEFHPETLIGVSGTFDTLCEIAEIRNLIEPSNSISESNFVMEAFELLRTELTSKTLQERIDTPGLIEFRAGMIVVALGLIHWVLTQHKFKSIRISKFSLKEGILHSMTKNLS